MLSTALIDPLQALFPDWVVGLLLIALALCAALLAYDVLVRIVRRGLQNRSPFTRSLVIRTQAPGRFALLVGAVSWAVKVGPVDDALEGLLLHGLLVAFIVLVGWSVLTALDIATALHLHRIRAAATNEFDARKHLTQSRILQRLFTVIIVVVTAGLALMTIPGVKQLGVSLLAAGGAASLIVGLALQPVLSNLMAGVQIGLTQPIRIDDAVQIQGELGHVEEIKATYVVVRLWDMRRLIVPLKFFLDQPFQNLTRDSANLVAATSILVDQRVPFDRMRARVEEIVKASPNWDGGPVKVQINDIRERCMEVRCLAGAPNVTAAGDLRAEVREHVMAWLQAEFPASLPRNGVEAPPPSSGDGSAPRPGPGDQWVQ